MKKLTCQFCMKPVTKHRFKPYPSYPIAYDLCDGCAEEHEEVSKRLAGLS